MKYFTTTLLLVSMLNACTAKLISTTTKHTPEPANLVTKYCLPKKLMQVTATYTVRQQHRYHKLQAVASKDNKRPKGSSYEKDFFNYYAVTVDGDIAVKYWLEDDTPTFCLTSNRRRGFNSTDIAYVSGTHILKSLNSSITPQANQLAVGTLKFVAAVASSAALGAVGPKLATTPNLPFKTDSVVVVATTSIPLTKIINVSRSLLSPGTTEVELASFESQDLPRLNSIPAGLSIPEVRLRLFTSLPSTLSIADSTANPQAAPSTSADGKNTTKKPAINEQLASTIQGIYYRGPYFCTILTTVKSYSIENTTTIQSNVSRVSFPQLGEAEVAQVLYWTGLTDGKQSINLTFNPEDGGLLSLSRSRESKDVSTLLDPDLVQKTIEAYEQRKKQNSELQQLKDNNELLDAKIINITKQKALDSLSPGN